MTRYDRITDKQVLDLLGDSSLRIKDVAKGLNVSYEVASRHLARMHRENTLKRWTSDFRAIYYQKPNPSPYIG